MEGISWPCSWTTGGRDPELAEGCDRAGEFIQDGKWLCAEHVNPDEDARIASHEHAMMYP